MDEAKKCVKCGMDTAGYKCVECGEECEHHDSNHACGPEACQAKCAGCNEAEIKCSC